MLEFIITGTVGLVIIAIGCIGLFCIIALLAITMLSEYNWKIRTLSGILCILAVIFICGSLGYINKDGVKLKESINSNCNCPCSQQKEI